jgi:hypothetical protein
VQELPMTVEERAIVDALRMRPEAPISHAGISETRFWAMVERWDAKVFHCGALPWLAFFVAKHPGSESSERFSVCVYPRAGVVDGDVVFLDANTRPS